MFRFVFKFLRRRVFRFVFKFLKKSLHFELKSKTKRKDGVSTISLKTCASDSERKTAIRTEAEAKAEVKTKAEAKAEKEWGQFFRRCPCCIPEWI